nr:hypothetical protein [Tanacetum cinerariifolium]
MVAILEKGEFNTDFHPMVDFIAASPLRYALTVKPTIFVSHIRQFWSTARIETTDEGTYILATVDGIQQTVSESSLRRNLKLRDKDGIVSLPDTELFENLTLMGQYSRRARIAQSSALPTVADKPASPIRDVSKGEACPTESGFIADQDRATIAKSSTLPHDSAPRVTSPAADEGKVEILRLKKRVQVLEDREGVAAKQSGDDAPIKGRSINEGEATAERISNDSEDITRVLTSIDAVTVLVGGIGVPTSSGSIPTAGPPATVISTGSEIDAQVFRELEEQQEKEDMRMNEQIDRDAEVARIHAEEELQGMIDSLDNSNETIAKKNLGWKVKDFNGLSFKEIEAKFVEVRKQVEDFIPMGLKEEAERLKRKGLNLEHEHVKKQKSSEEAPEIEKSTKEITEDKIKEMMQLVPIEDVYVQALQVKHPIIDWKTQNCMHAPVEWKLYDLSGVHHVTAKDKEIFMQVEKDYPLRKGSSASGTIPDVSATIPATAPTVLVTYTRKRKGVIIRDPKEELSLKTFAKTPAETPKEEIDRDHDGFSKDIDWDAAMDHVSQKSSNPQYIKRYQGMKKRPQTESEAHKNMMIYLKNTAGYKMDFFKGMTYAQICLIFQARFDENIRFLFKSREEMEAEDQEIIKSINETHAQKAAKRRKLSKEAKDLRKRLEVVEDEDDDVFVEATPLATVQLILLVERRYPLSRFTLEQLVNVTRLQVEEKSEMSLQLLRLTRQQFQEYQQG